MYSLIQGYALAFLFHIFGDKYLYPAVFALLITIFIVLLMLVLYRAKIVKVEKKFASILIMTIFMGIIIAIAYFIISFIPFLQPFIEYLQNNSFIYITVGIVSIIISALFLLVDFEVLNRSITSEISKKYEWLAAYGLSFSIINVYFRIFELLIDVTNKK